MSDDQLADHVSRQMTFFHKKYEPDVEPVQEEKVTDFTHKNIVILMLVN